VRKVPLGIFISGSGTNLQALLDACREGQIDAEVRVVLSDRAEAYGLERARQAGISAVHVPVGREASAARAEGEQRQLEVLAEHGVELVCLAGYMRKVGRRLLEAYPERVMNIHPALLPGFPGGHGQRDAVEYGARVAGCTVHFADAEFDRGPIIIQAAVPVLPGDDESSLAVRILAQEHRLYRQAIQWYAAGRLRIEGRQVVVEGAPPPTLAEALVSPGLEIR